MKNKWQTKKLEEVCEILDSQRIPVTKRDRSHGEFPYYGATGIVDYVDDYIFDEKLVLVGEDGAKWAVGEHSAFIVDGKYWVNNHAHVLRVNRKILLDEWLVYFLNSENLLSYVTGLTVPKLNQTNLKKIKIPVPPLKEQKRIVKKLDKVLGDIEILIDNTKKSITKTEAAIDNYNYQYYQKLINKYDSKLLSDISALVRGPFGSSLKKSMFVDKGFAVYEQRNAIDKLQDNFRYFVNKEKFLEMERFSVNDGDILMSCSGTIGEFLILKDTPVKGIINQALLKITPQVDKIIPEFLVFTLKNFVGDGSSLSKGAAIKNIIAVKELKKINIPIPSIKQQMEILKEIEKNSNKITLILKNYHTNLINYDELKKSILAKAFAGEL